MSGAVTAVGSAAAWIAGSVGAEAAAADIGFSALTAGGISSAAVTTAGSIAGSIFSAGSALSLLQGAKGIMDVVGGYQEKEQNEKATAQNEQYEQAQEQTSLTEQKVNMARQIGAENAAYGSSGVDANSGSAEDVKQFSTGQGLLSQALLKYQGVEKQNQISMQGYNQQRTDYTQIGDGLTALGKAGTSLYKSTNSIFPTLTSSSS